MRLFKWRISYLKNERMWIGVKTRILCILAVAILLTISAVACAEQLPSPTLKTDVTVGIVSEGSPVVKDSFTIQLIEGTEAVDEVLARAQQAKQIEDLFDEETLKDAAEYLPENLETEKLMLAELYTMTVDNYDADYGDVDICCEFSVEYADDAVLLGMIGLAMEESAEIAWTPIRATAEKGNVMLSLPRELLEQISNGGDAVFLLLQNQQ